MSQVRSVLLGIWQAVLTSPEASVTMETTSVSTSYHGNAE